MGVAGQKNAREYSIYSSEQEDYFKVLIKAAKPGDISQKLKNLLHGDFLSLEGPMGFFTLEQKERTIKKALLIATGTGIAPFHSFVKSNPELDYTWKPKDLRTSINDF